MIPCCPQLDVGQRKASGSPYTHTFYRAMLQVIVTDLLNPRVARALVRVSSSTSNARVEDCACYSLEACGVNSLTKSGTPAELHPPPNSSFWLNGFFTLAYLSTFSLTLSMFLHTVLHLRPFWLPIGVLVNTLTTSLLKVCCHSRTDTPASSTTQAQHPQLFALHVGTTGGS